TRIRIVSHSRDSPARVPCACPPPPRPCRPARAGTTRRPPPPRCARGGRTPRASPRARASTRLARPMPAAPRRARTGARRAAHPPPHPPRRHPTPAADVPPHGRHRTARGTGDDQAVPGVGPELGAGHKLLPVRVLTRRPAGVRCVAPVETRALREVALEVGRVQVDALDHAAPAAPQHDPIMTGDPAAPP